MTTHFSTWVQSLRRWWRVDRIRISPHDGEILRLGLADVLLVGEEWFEITGRYVEQMASGPVIVYDCSSAQTRCRLRVEPGVPWPRILRVDADRETPISSDDIDIFSVRGSSA